MNNVTITITRYEMLDSDPKSLIIGFRLTCHELRESDYIESHLLLNDIKGKTDNEILDIAYESIRGEIQEKENRLKNKSPILGSIYIPKNNKK
jgi:hypothetical protein